MSEMAAATTLPGEASGAAVKVEESAPGAQGTIASTEAASIQDTTATVPVVNSDHTDATVDALDPTVLMKQEEENGKDENAVPLSPPPTSGGADSTSPVANSTSTVKMEETTVLPAALPKKPTVAVAASEPPAPQDNEEDDEDLFGGEDEDEEKSTTLEATASAPRSDAATIAVVAPAFVAEMGGAVAMETPAAAATAAVPVPVEPPAQAPFVSSAPTTPLRDTNASIPRKRQSMDTSSSSLLNDDSEERPSKLQAVGASSPASSSMSPMVSHYNNLTPAQTGRFGLPASIQIPPSVTGDLLNGKLLDMVKALPANLIQDALQEYDDAVGIKGNSIRNHGAYLYGVIKRYTAVHERASQEGNAGLLPMGEALTATVHTRLEQLVASGYCTQTEMDDKVKSKIKMLSEKDAMFAIEELASVDRSQIRNFGSFFMGILNRYMRGDHSSKIQHDRSGHNNRDKNHHHRGGGGGSGGDRSQHRDRHKSSYGRERSQDRFHQPSPYGPSSAQPQQGPPPPWPAPSPYGPSSAPQPPPALPSHHSMNMPQSQYMPQHQGGNQPMTYPNQQNQFVSQQQQGFNPSMGGPPGNMATNNGPPHQFGSQMQQQPPSMMSNSQQFQPQQQQFNSSMMQSSQQPPQQQQYSMGGGGPLSNVPGSYGNTGQNNWQAQQQPLQASTQIPDIFGLADKAAAAIQGLTSKPLGGSAGGAYGLQANNFGGNQQQQASAYGQNALQYAGQQFGQPQQQMSQYGQQQMPQQQQYGGAMLQQQPMGGAMSYGQPPPAHGQVGGGVGGGGGGGKRRTTAQFEQLSMNVQYAVRNIVATQQIERMPDEGIVGMINDLPEDLALQTIQKFTTIDKSQMRSKMAYFAGVLRRELEKIHRR